ncbi:MAG TPA: hypothetical protein P5562_01760 [Candidatus Woesebacteria bacterium]|nr:hypothetical protein [Candidatus Woesebacteria bacterium]
MRSTVRTRWIIRIGPKAKIKCQGKEMVDRGEVILEESNEVFRNYDASVVLSRLPKEKIEALKRSWRGKDVKRGDLIGEVGGIIKKKIFAPVDGKLYDIDEFYNLVIKVEEKNKRIVRSPVRAKVGEISQKKVLLEFDARVIRGQGVVTGRTWGDSDLKEYSAMSDLNYASEGRIILVDNPDQTFITKAEVVGVVGLVVRTIGEVEADIPILKIEPSNWEALLKMGEKNRLYRTFLNTKSERLLVVEDWE